MGTTISPNTVLDEAAVAAFAAELRGRLIRPADSEYDAARAVWNGMIDRYPAFIARCSGTADVVAAVNFAREHQLLLSVRGGGHNVAGSAVCDGGLVIDLSAMRGVFVDPTARTARVQGGATWADLDREAQLFGLATPGGLVSTTGVAGLTLHGGFGGLRRKYGLSLDNLLSVEIVLADGRVATASSDENPDLFWAVRGAGSNFGVVTSFEFRLHPVGPTLAACTLLYPLPTAPDVMRRWRDFMAKAPNEVSSSGALWGIPKLHGIPEELQGKPTVVIGAVYSGPVDEGLRLMQPLRELAEPLMDWSGPRNYTELQSGLDAAVPAGRRYYWKARYVDNLSDELIDELHTRALARPSILSPIEFWHHGGAMSAIGAAETAFGRRDAPYMITFAASWEDPSDDERNIAWARDGYAALARYSAHGAYLNFPGFGEERDELVRASYGPNYARLVELKGRYDPTNLFRMNQNIKPPIGG